MKWEIERKFLVVGDGWRAGTPHRIVQGYLARTDQVSVRVRRSDHQAWLSVKAARQGMARPEFEYAIPPDDADALLALCGTRRIEKRRHVSTYDGMTWEVDEFEGTNSGLVVAEIELEHPTQTFSPPPWLGTEVTEDPRYYNAQLAQTPYTEWQA